jgi:hypothetical protein
MLEARAQHLQGAVKWREMARDGDAGRAATGCEIEIEHARLAQVVYGCCAPRVSGPRLPVSAVLPQAPPIAVK